MSLLFKKSFIYSPKAYSEFAVLMYNLLSTIAGVAAYSCFKKQLEYSYSVLNLGRSVFNETLANYIIAVVSAFQGDHIKAYQFLDELIKIDIVPLWWISLTKHDPLLESIRDEEHFQNIVRDMEDKYQAEHERVRQWLEENDR